jgi:hypothetical protein
MVSSNNGHSSSGDSTSSSAPRAMSGSYGLSVIGNLRDWHDFYYLQGLDKYFSRIERYGSTVLRINVPRGPFFTIHPQVMALLDAKSFTTLFDVTKVEKKDVLVGYTCHRGPSLTGTASSPTSTHPSLTTASSSSSFSCSCTHAWMPSSFPSAQASPPS